MTTPLIVLRDVGGSPVAYVRGTDQSVEDIQILAKHFGGDADNVANRLRIDRELVDAALAYEGTKDRRTANASGAGQAEVLDSIGKALGILAGATALVYCVGGILLVLRLVNENLPWQPLIAQLPRDLLLAAGATPALLAALVALFYLGMRFVHPGGNPRRRELPGTFGQVIVTWALVSSPFAAAWVYRAKFALPSGKLVWPQLPLALSAMLLLALLANSVRLALSDRHPDENWKRPRARMVVSGAYALLAIPAMVAAIAITPLNDAKVCTTSDFEEMGTLIGRTGDSIALAEPRNENRRIAMLPASQVEEIFVGHRAFETDCDVGDARTAVMASKHARDALQAAATTSKLAKRGPLGSDESVGAWMSGLREQVRIAGRSALNTADLARRMHVDDKESREAGNEAIRLIAESEEAVDGSQTVAVEALVAAASSCASATSDTADDILAEAVKRQPATG